MNSIQNFGANLYQSFWDVWYGFASFVPSLVIAILIFAIAWILGALIQKIVEGIFQSLKIDNLLKTAGLEDVVKRSGYTLKSGTFVGSIVKWFIIVIGLIMSFNELNLSDVNSFLHEVVTYIPHVLVAVLVLMVAVVVADTLSKIVVASARAAHLKSAHLLGKITRWSILVFAILTALIELGVAATLINTLVLGVVIAFSLAIGLSFGLGGKDVAGRVIEKLWNQISERE